MVGLEEAWQYSTGTGVKICVIDDGLDFLHPAPFATPEKIAAYRDMLDKQGMRKPLHQFEENTAPLVQVWHARQIPGTGVHPMHRSFPSVPWVLGSVWNLKPSIGRCNREQIFFSCSPGPPDGDFLPERKSHFTYPLPDHTRLALEYATTKGRDGKGCAVFFAAGNGDEDIRHDGYASSPLVLSVGAVNKQGKKGPVQRFW